MLISVYALGRPLSEVTLEVILPGRVRSYKLHAYDPALAVLAVAYSDRSPPEAVRSVFAASLEALFGGEYPGIGRHITERETPAVYSGKVVLGRRGGRDVWVEVNKNGRVTFQGWGIEQSVVGCTLDHAARLYAAERA